MRSTLTFQIMLSDYHMYGISQFHKPTILSDTILQNEMYMDQHTMDMCSIYHIQGSCQLLTSVGAFGSSLLLFKLIENYKVK